MARAQTALVVESAVRAGGCCLRCRDCHSYGLFPQITMRCVRSDVFWDVAWKLFFQLEGGSMPCPYLKCSIRFLCYVGSIYTYYRAHVLEQSFVPCCISACISQFHTSKVYSLVSDMLTMSTIHHHSLNAILRIVTQHQSSLRFVSFPPWLESRGMTLKDVLNTVVEIDILLGRFPGW